MRKAFPEGTHWVTLSQSRNLLIQQGQLVRNLTGFEQALTTKQEGKDALREALEGRRILVILDDVWKVDNAEAFLVDVPLARLLITTRNREVLVGLGAEEHWVDALSAQRCAPGSGRVDRREASGPVGAKSTLT